MLSWVRVHAPGLAPVPPLCSALEDDPLAFAIAEATEAAGGGQGSSEIEALQEVTLAPADPPAEAPGTEQRTANFDPPPPQAELRRMTSLQVRHCCARQAYSRRAWL